MNKKKAVSSAGPFQKQPHIVKIDLHLDGEPVAPGTLVRIKHDKTAWTYMSMYHNQEKDVKWVDLRSPMGFKSVRPDKIAGEYTRKIPRKRKSNE